MHRFLPLEIRTQYANVFALFPNKFMSGLNILTSAVAHVIMPSDLDSRNRALVHARLTDQFLAQVSLMHPFLPTCSVYKTQCHPELCPHPSLLPFFPSKEKYFSLTFGII